LLMGLLVMTHMFSVIMFNKVFNLLKKTLYLNKKNYGR
jgi:hypothetical protein